MTRNICLLDFRLPTPTPQCLFDNLNPLHIPPFTLHITDIVSDFDAVLPSDLYLVSLCFELPPLSIIPKPESQEWRFSLITTKSMFYYLDSVPQLIHSHQWPVKPVVTVFLLLCFSKIQLGVCIQFYSCWLMYDNCFEDDHDYALNSRNSRFERFHIVSYFETKVDAWLRCAQIEWCPPVSSVVYYAPNLTQTFSEGLF